MGTSQRKGRVPHDESILPGNMYGAAADPEGETNTVWRYLQRAQEITRGGNFTDSALQAGCAARAVLIAGVKMQIDAKAKAGRGRATGIKRTITAIFRVHDVS
jgi:hypothetical protein